jgi:hypothetical protein
MDVDEEIGVGEKRKRSQNSVFMFQENGIEILNGKNEYFSFL